MVQSWLTATIVPQSAEGRENSDTIPGPIVMVKGDVEWRVKTPSDLE
jgi:hypothetical protein